MNPVTSRLLALKPKPLKSLMVLHHIHTQGLGDDLDQLLTLGPDIEEALEEAERLEESSKRIVETCLRLQPTPSKQPPLGF